MIASARVTSASRLLFLGGCSLLASGTAFLVLRQDVVPRGGACGEEVHSGTLERDLEDGSSTAERAVGTRDVPHIAAEPPRIRRQVAAEEDHSAASPAAAPLDPMRELVDPDAVVRTRPAQKRNEVSAESFDRGRPDEAPPEFEDPTFEDEFSTQVPVPCEAALLWSARVLEEGTERPVAAALVEASSGPSVRTDALGGFRLRLADRESIELTISAAGYESCSVVVDLVGSRLPRSFTIRRRSRT
jgi:hypothetical protein